MKTNIALIGLTISLLLGSQTAFAQTAEPQARIAHAQSVAKHVPSKSVAVKTKSSTRKMRVVRQALPGQAKAIRSVSKGRVIHTANLQMDSMNIFRPSVQKTKTPNFYHD